MEYYDHLKKGCHSNCKFGRNCLAHLHPEELGQYIHDFWGTEDAAAKLPRERYESIKSIFEMCRAKKEVRSDEYYIFETICMQFSILIIHISG